MRAAGLSCPAAMDRYAISGRDVGEDYLKAAAPKAEVSVALDAEADSRVTVAGSEDEAPVIQAIGDAGFEFHGNA